MKLPVIRGVIDRRILVNYHADPLLVAQQLPAPFRPKLIHGKAMVGICLIRLKELRPAFAPAWLGMRSENAAHRTAVEWDDNGVVREGVYVRRRDTNSRFNVLTGGRLFPGYHHFARFNCQESETFLEVSVVSQDGEINLNVRGRPGAQLPPASVFASMQEASAFFQAGSLGYSATPDNSRFQGLELKTLDWRIEPLEVEAVSSSLFDDVSVYPAGSIAFDSALLMRGLQHEWYERPDLCCTAVPALMA